MMRDTATLLAGLFLALLVWCGPTRVEASDQPVAPLTSQIATGIQKGIQARKDGDYQAALALLQPLANKGYPEAQYNLGIMYEQGEGVPKDYHAALHWYHQASSRGYGDASFQIGRMYVWGRGVSRDAVKADKWYMKAANQGSVEGQLTTAGIYGVYAITRRSESEQYRIKAAKWFMIAKACGAEELNGNDQTAQNFRFLEKQMTPAEISKASHLTNEWLAGHSKLACNASNTASAGTITDPEKVNQFHRGQTTAVQVKAALGTPYYVDHNKDGRFIYMYQFDLPNKDKPDSPHENGIIAFVFNAKGVFQYARAYEKNKR